MKVGIFIVVFLVAWVALSCLFAWMLATAWATVAVPVFGWRPITFWQAWWLCVGLRVVGGFFKRSLSAGKA